jgi:MFS family permease
MCAFAMLSNVQRTSIGIAGERIEPDLHLSQMQIGWMMWAFTVVYMIMQAPGGVFGQRYGARLTFVLIGLHGLAVHQFHHQVEQAFGSPASVQQPGNVGVLEMRLFAGLTETESAEVLRVSIPTVRRDVTFARAWLTAQLNPPPKLSEKS